jgi:cellulose synthase/poly-beta-1,6-N-acetylglucosamine synthase-like glycosyltransferase
LKVAIVIPCKNEEDYIEKCILSILRSNYPKELISIYVCDGLSTDKTIEIIERIIKNNPCVHLLINKAQTTPQGLNLGLKTANSDVKIILGAHSEVDPNFIQENVNVLQKHSEVGCAGGVIKNVFENKTSEIIGAAMSSPFGVGNAHFRTGAKDGLVDTVAFGAYRKEVFENIGYFDEELVRNQDDEFNFRLSKNGYKIFLSQKIISLYYVRASYKKLFKQYYQYGYWKVFVNKKHQTVTSIRQLIPMLFVLFLFQSLFSSFLHDYLFFLNLTTLLMYIVLAFVFANKVNEKLKNLPLIVLTFLILHLSYGSGYLKGIYDFIVWNKKPVKKSMELSR